MLFGFPATHNSLNNVIEMSKQEAEHWLDRIKQQHDKVKLKTEVMIALKPSITGDIVDYAHERNVDLVVVGSKGRSGYKRALLGSVASAVVTYAHCPVLVVK